jgi:RNA polymerase sigma-70 factor (ECF subfamily)
MKSLNEKEKINVNSTIPDEEIVESVLAGESRLFEVLMRRYNERLYRVAHGILRDRNEAEDVVQDSYVRAYKHLSQFAGAAKFSTWLIKIVIHEALARIRTRNRYSKVSDWESMVARSEKSDNPEQELARREIGQIMEEAIEALPEKYRIVFMMREVEGMNTEETAESLSLGEEAIKSRLFRARALLRKSISAKLSGVSSNLFKFDGARCDSIVDHVMERIKNQMPG